MKGVYTLLIGVRRRIDVDVGKLGRFEFEPGEYAYTGSAMGTGAASLEGRIRRHLGDRARKFWHIDHLLGSGGAKVIGIVYAETDSKVECAVNGAIRRSMGGWAPVPKFGSSDCLCESHLLRVDGLGPEDFEEGVRGAYSLLGLRPLCLKGARLRPTFFRMHRRISL
ncbi:MAG: GIY-YIG nuclease family protein [Candidatus Bathyarchaeia archaeon]